MRRLKLIEERFKSLGGAVLRIAGVTLFAVSLSYFLDSFCRYIDKTLTPNEEVPVFVINLDSAKDRLSFFDSQLDNYSRFSAVDWREISVGEDEPVLDSEPERMTVSSFIEDQSDMKKYVAECLRYPDTKLRLYKKYFRENDIGCFFSHLALWNQCYKNAYDKVLVFEDDVVLKPFFRTKLKMFLRKIPQDFDIAFLGCRDSFRKARPFRIGMHAYVINLRKTNLRKFFADFYSMFPIDYMMGMTFRKLKCCFNRKQILAVNEEFKSQDEFDADIVDPEDLASFRSEIGNFFENHFK
ncbi:MAG: glycosyltransferase family 25 protein [Alphaproteobacteria bacterium]|nr:glycosyltransferase family 25 protein [Alphaproteobacteria bacterium]MBO7641834.1 glycosyltransferase family 25 protein [Alphaproteobacteria bacterium]